MRARIMLASLFACTSLAACASTEMFPPGVDGNGWSGKTMAMPGPRLWQPSDAAGYLQRIRVTVSPSLFRFRFSIRLDEDASGRAFGHYVRRTLVDHRWETVETFTFPVSAADVARLDDIFARGSFLRDPVENWEAAQDDPSHDIVCIDGIEVILERASADGYRFSTANVSCAVPREFYDYTMLVVQLAGDRLAPMRDFLDWD